MTERGYDLTNPYEAASRRRRPVTGIHVEKAEFDRVCAERDALKTLVLEAREELTQHGWGDFHYGEQPQDASVVAIIRKIDQLVAEGGGAE